MTPRSTSFLALLFCIGLFMVGCSSSNPDDTATEEAAENEIALADLKVMVIGDEEIGTTITRQWSARRDANVEIEVTSPSDIVQSGFKLPRDIDIVIYPPRFLGEFITSEQIDELAPAIWDDEQLNKQEILRHPRTTNVRYSNKTWAVPLGDPNFVLLYRRDVLEALGEDVPETWADFDKLSKRLQSAGTLKNENGNELPTSISLPLGEYWRSQMFLVRVAPYIRTRGRLSIFFERDTLKPMVGNPAFERGLKELTELCSADAESQLQKTPKEAYLDIVEGRSAMAITWPSTSFGEDSLDAQLSEKIGISRVPGSEALYSPSENEWGTRAVQDSKRVAVVGFDGLVASISRNSSNVLSAQEFMRWLPSKQISNSVMTKSASSAPFRASHLGTPLRWAGELISPVAGEDYAKAIREINDETVIVVFPRIPGQSRYLAALGKAVEDSITGKSTPAEALKATVNTFEAITGEFDHRKLQRWIRSSREF